MSDTNQLADSLPNGYTTDATTYLKDIKYSVDQHFHKLGTEIDKLEILKTVFTERRIQSNNIEKVVETVTQKNQTLKDTLTSHVSTLDTDKVQLDQIYSERSADYESLNQELSLAKLKTSELQSKFSSEKGSLNKQIMDQSEIQDLIEKINKAKWDLQKERRDVRRLEIEYDGLKNTSDTVQDFMDEIYIMKEPRYDPNELKRAEEENLALKERLTKLEQNKNLMAKTISSVDDDIYKLNKQKQQLSEHDGYNLMLKFERDEIRSLVDLSARRQKDLYNDNIEKLRQIKEIEYEILSRDKDILDLVAQSSINGLKDTLTADLQDRLKILERDINSVDKGANKLDRDINSINIKLVNQAYNDKLNGLLTKVQNLSSRNTENSYTKDGLKTDADKLELDLSTIDTKSVTISEIDGFKGRLTNLETTLTGSEILKNQHTEELKKLNSDFELIKAEIIEMLEKKFKQTQQNDAELLTVTDKNSKNASTIIDTLNEKIQPSNPHMRKFLRKLQDAKSMRDQLNYEDGKNKASQKEQAERPISGSDYFAFLYRLSHDQDELDDEIISNRDRSNDLLRALNELLSEFEEANFQKKDEIILHCRNVITLRLDEYPDIEEKMKILESGVEELNALSAQTTKAFDKSHPDYAEIVEINEGIQGLAQDTQNIKTDKNKIGSDLQRLNQFLNRPDLKELKMDDIYKFQKECNDVSDLYTKTHDGLHDAIENMKDFRFRLTSILENIRHRLKQELDDLTEEIENRLSRLNKFLKPEEPTADSIQRPQRVNGALNSYPVSNSDKEFELYQGYLKLVNENLVRCNQAATDLDILERDVNGPLSTYKNYLTGHKNIVEQIVFYQEIITKISIHEQPSGDLIEVITQILAHLDGRKEDEIMNFLFKLRADMLKQAQSQFKQADLDLNELDKKLKEVNGNNDGFIGTLNSSNNNPKNKEKVDLINTLLKESETSKKDLKKINTDKDKTKQLFDTMNQKLSNPDPSKLKLKDMYDILADLDQCKVVITKKIQELVVIDHDIEERKKRWRDFITNTEAKDKLIKELLSLIPLMRDKYERMCKNCNFCSNSINGFVLVNQKIQENSHYQTTQAPCSKRDELGLQMGSFEEKKISYGTRIDKLESYNEASLKDIDSEAIQGFINESTELIKNLDADIHELETIVTYLKEERKDFKDGDIYTNNERVKDEITLHDSRLKSLITEFESIKDTLQSLPISNPKLLESLRIVEDNIIKSSDLINAISREYNDVNKSITSESMTNAKLATLALIIERLGQLSSDLKQLDLILSETEGIFVQLQSELIEIHYIKRLNEMRSHLSILIERLKRLNDLIEKLIELSKTLEGYTSDNEEDAFVNDLENELIQVKRQHSNAEEQLGLIREDIEKIMAALKANSEKIDESKLEELDKAISDNSGVVEGIERLVDSKIQRFADMDPYKKFMRRQKEHRKLNIILEDRENMINELKRDASSDLNNPDASEDLKQVCSEVLDELDPLEEEFDSIKQRLLLLGTDIDGYLEKSAKTEMTIEEIFELLYANVEIKKKLKLMLTTIDEFSKTILEVRKKYLIKRAESPVKKVYKAAKGDAVDQMLGDWLNTHGCEFEIKRLGGGFYMFGEKKIFAKIINGKLIIRVGGGYMNIDEFMKHYGLLELARGQRVYKMEYESLNYDELMSNDDDLSQPENRSEVIGIAQVKKNLRGSFKGSPGKAGSPINRQGSPRAGGTFKNRPGSPKVGQNRPGSPKSFKSGMPSAAKIEESLRKMEQDAKEGKLKEGYTTSSFKM